MALTLSLSPSPLSPLFLIALLLLCLMVPYFWFISQRSRLPSFQAVSIPPTVFFIHNLFFFPLCHCSFQYEAPSGDEYEKYEDLLAQTVDVLCLNHGRHSVTWASLGFNVAFVFALKIVNPLSSVSSNSSGDLHYMVLSTSRGVVLKRF